jgi:DNA-binding response OmpR family regulator
MTHPASTILLAEGDAPLRTFLADNHTADGYDLLVADRRDSALRLLEQADADLALVDLALPDGSGLDLVTRVRHADRLSGRMDPTMPLILLSGRDGELDRLRAFERGCDDWIAKPFSYPELRARVAALLRRARGQLCLGRLRAGALVIDPSTREVTVHGRRVELSQTEFALLRALVSEPTRVFTKKELLRDVWGFKSLGSTRTLDSHACRLRQKLSGPGHRFVINVWGVGYRLLEGPGVTDIADGGTRRARPHWWSGGESGLPVPQHRVGDVGLLEPGDLVL